MSKPIDEEEMLLQIKALLRRAKTADDRKMTVGDVVLDYDSLTMTRGDAVIVLLKRRVEINIEKSE